MGDQSQANNKRIAKNTIYLYIRMMILMFISFYTSRVILKYLGVTDFGILNVVGGLASMFVFFRSSLANVTQRYLNIELGKGNIEGARNVFRLHQTIYIIVTFCIFLLAETIGLWFVYNKLVIPAERLYAAVVVYHITIVSLCFTIISVVYNSVLIARENMKVYSYVGIVEGFVKLANAYIISVIEWDKLITYQILQFLLSLSLFFFYVGYCKHRYNEVSFRFLWNKNEARKAFNMVGWNSLGTIVWAINDQGVNVLLNLFFGPAVNAARAVSFQVSQAISNFGANFMVSASPQIVKSYSNKDFEYLYKLFFSTSKYCVFLLWIFCLPVMLCIDEILSFWLADVPEYTSTFTIWVLIYSLVNMLNNPIWTLALAIGELKNYILIGSSVFFLAFPLSYVFLLQGASPISVFVIIVIVRIIYLVVVINIIRCYIDISLKDYLYFVIYPVIKVLFFSFIVGYFVSNNLSNSIFDRLFVIVVSALSVLLSVWILGLTQKERVHVIKILKDKVIQ